MYLETSLKNSEKEEIRQLINDGVSFDPSNKIQKKLTLNEEQSYDWHRDSKS